MSTSRQLPQRANPLLVREVTESEYDSLVKRRRLGQTDLAPKGGPAALINATKPKNLGTFDYAHLRVPLPKHVVSGIFNPSPASYFLMRRSQDGFISATGMFKATFPWAEQVEEEIERKYIKSLSTTSPEETAGNVWVPPAHALELAQEYGISVWIKALLDDAEIEINHSKDGSSQKSIKSPPKMGNGAEANGDDSPSPTPTPSAQQLRRSRRSMSPSKIPLSPKWPIATPRKSRKNATLDSSTIEDAKKSLTETHAKPESAHSTPESKTAISSKSEAETSSDVVKVTVDTDVVNENGVETTHTHVAVEMPAGSPDLPLPEDTAAMIAKAKEMVEAAIRADDAARANQGVTKRSIKRSAEEAELEDDEEEVAVEEGSEVQDGPIVKRAKTSLALNSELKKERVKKRTLIGIAASLAVGTLIPWAFGAMS